MSEVSCLGAGVNYPGFISQKDLLRRERIYIHAITINLSGPGCIQSFLENLNYIEKLRMEGKVENCPLALQQHKCVALCNIVSPLTFPSLCLCILK